MRTILYLVTLPFATLWYGGTCIVARMFGVPRVQGGVYDRAQGKWARLLLKVSGVRVTVQGGGHINRNVSQVIAANHASFFDILALLGCLPVDPKFVAKIELFRIPIFGQAIKAAGMVAIDRGNIKEAFGAYDIAAKRIKEERLHVLVYPEGTRSRTGEMLPFKKGPFVLAIAANAPIVPVYVSGAFGIMPKGSIAVHPQPITITIGEAIPTDGLTYGDREALAHRVRSAMESLKQQSQIPNV